MNLQSFLDQVAAEEEAKTERRDIRSIVESAKRNGLIQSAGEERALKIAARKRLKVEIDKTGGTKAAELATMQSRWMDVTPAMAELWLKNNFNNRPVRQDTVNAYAREMRRGKWLPVHQGIAFNDRDELCDGQHRLLAIVQSGCTVRLLVTFGMPSKVAGTRMTGMDVVDRGATRSVADQLKIQHHYKDGSIMAMIVNRLVNLCLPERTRRLSVGEVLDVHDVFGEPIDWVIEHRPKAHGLKQAGVLAAFAFAIPCGERVREMFLALMSGDVPADEPLGLLRTFLTSEQAILLSRGNDRALAELVLQTLWLEWLECHGKRVASLELSTEGADYFRELRKEEVARVRAIFEGPAATAPAKAEVKCTTGRKAA